MKGTEFIKLYKSNRGLKKVEAAKEKIDTFWDTLFKVLSEEKKVTFKGWGKFEKKEIKSRKILIPPNKEAIYTKPKTIIKFKAGNNLKRSFNDKVVKDNE